VSVRLPPALETTMLLAVVVHGSDVSTFEFAVPSDQTVLTR
jgi:hypothetical protein